MAGSGYTRRSRTPELSADTGLTVLRSFDPGNSSSGTVEPGGKLPMLRMGDIGLGACSRLASLGLSAICGLLFFEGLIARRPAAMRRG